VPSEFRLARCTYRCGDLAVCRPRAQTGLSVARAPPSPCARENPLRLLGQPLPAIGNFARLEPESEVCTIDQDASCVSRLSMTTYHRELGETNGDHGEGFVVPHQAAIAAQPRECALDHPAATQDLEAALLVGAFDDFQLDRQPNELVRELGPA